MADQFGETTSEALKAMFICNPVKKRVSVEGEVVAEDGIRNEKLHYMCYVFDPGRTNAEDKVFEVQNEYETGKYQAGGPRMSCVPSLKQRLE